MLGDGFKGGKENKIHCLKLLLTPCYLTQTHYEAMLQVWLSSLPGCSDVLPPAGASRESNESRMVRIHKDWRQLGGLTL